MDKVNINEAMANPSDVFGSPDKVVDNDALTKSQKRDVLLRWQTDAIQTQGSESGEAGGGPSRLHDITRAIQNLA